MSAALPQDLLLCIFIHGFNGTDETFGGFPNRLQHILTETIENVTVECIVFPAYETKGELTAAVERFAEWLTTLTVDREVARGMGGGAGTVKIVLCGHSMGGLLAADTFLAIANARPDDSAPLWPKIIACLAFDTPYLGIHPHVFKSSATKVVEYAKNARDVATGVGILGALGGYFGKQAGEPGPTPSQAKGREVNGHVTASPPISPSSPAPNPARSGRNKWTPLAYGAGAALLAGAAASAAYYKRGDVNLGWSWASDHMKYVKNLWDEKALKMRVENLVTTGEEVGVVFRTFYTYLPGKLPFHPTPRSFIILPQPNTHYASCFAPAPNSLALDEVAAHTGMFQGSSNDGYYNLGLQTAKAVREAVVLCRNNTPSK